ncbi:MAG: YCF48-related protein [Algoriphagus sp.]|uniref:WD40/YVTN/BNR-like repeat-containing protein n=1 Tax=Algoriphagus sp. TaxID=1872435 RepID=UPI0027313B6A|nr:YCF48-related protein [Algoriphagus sp.]MDP2039860.1 YCF48-related protein [Algoriphagus sp.]MDP3472332.1 YCF48-related protein [Algoriphagus sp.]
MKLSTLLFLGLFWAIFSQAQNLQWKEFNTPVKASLRGLSPVSGQVCWASGSGGTWLKTTDGGETWEHGVIAGLDSVDFRSIHAFDANTAVVASAGQPALILRTEDGGRTWHSVHEEGDQAFFDGISFLNKKRGFVIGDPVNGNWMVLETLDGGKNWKSLENLPPAETGEAAFAASASSLIATKSGLIFGTGGSVSNLYFYDFSDQTWDKVKTPMLQGEASQGIFAVTSTESGIVAVGGDYTKPDFRDRNAVRFGADSFEIPIASPLGYRSGLGYFRKIGIMLAVGPSGSDFSKDGGLNWENFSMTGYHAVKVSSDGNSTWASGGNGRIGRLIH